MLSASCTTNQRACNRCCLAVSPCCSALGLLSLCTVSALWVQAVLGFNARPISCGPQLCGPFLSRHVCVSARNQLCYGSTSSKSCSCAASISVRCASWNKVLCIGGCRILLWRAPLLVSTSRSVMSGAQFVCCCCAVLCAFYQTQQRAVVVARAGGGELHMRVAVTCRWHGLGLWIAF